MKHPNQLKLAPKLTLLVGLCMMIVMFLLFSQTTSVTHASQPAPAAISIGFRTADPGPFLSWPLPWSIGLSSISRLPNSQWTYNFLGISTCPPYPALIDPGTWYDGNSYGGNRNFILPGVPDSRVKWMNADDGWPFNNAFACYSDPNGHAGTDIFAANGTNILAAAYADRVSVWYGNGQYRITLRHSNVNGSGQTWYTYYVHASASTYPVGDTYPAGGIPAGTVIAKVGSGHLHFQVDTNGGYWTSMALNPFGIDQAPWNGCLFLDVSLCPTGQSSTYNAKWVSQSSNPTIIHGESAELSVTFQNSGIATWSNIGPNTAKLGTTDPTNNSTDYPSPFVCPTWLGAVVPTSMTEATAAPGSNATFNFKICVPANMAPGIYRISVAPLIDHITWMFQPGVTVYWNITVTVPPIFLGNIDSNNLLDLIYPYDYGNSNMTTLVQLAPQSGLASWAAWSTSTGAGNFALNHCKPMLFGDVNGDGRDDLICPYDYGNADMTTLVQLAPQSGLAGWTALSTRTGAGNFDLGHCKPMLLGDVNGDGRDDLICPYAYPNANMTTLVQLAPQSGLASWTALSTSTGEHNFDLDHCKPMLIGDVNGDGRDDLICPYAYPNANMTTLVQLAPQSGLAGWTALSTSTGEGNFDLDHCKPMLIGDVNGDGRDDLVCPYDYGNADMTTLVQLAPQSGLTGWTALSTRTGAGSFDLGHCKPMLIGDVNGDGRDDLVCPYDYGNADMTTLVQLAPQSGLASWTALSTRTGTGSFDLGHCRRLLIGDITGDGRDDLVCPYDYPDGTTLTLVQISGNSSLTNWKTWSSRYTWANPPATMTRTPIPTSTRTPTITPTRTPTKTLTPTRTLTPTPTKTPAVITFQSAGAYDGWVLESSEISNAGGTMNAAATTFNLGDDAAKKQYRGILSFLTGGLPDNAVITKVTLKLQKSAIGGGGDPLTMFGGFIADVKNGFFGTTPALQIADFQAAASASYGPFTPAPVSNWYTIDLTGGKAYVNKLAAGSGLTQIRLRFKVDDNNNTIANYLSLYSGNAPAASRPQLVITYIVP
jgi:murein DD-endopeptidase MepM/ murein hydrolase activator NlpD